MQQQKKVQRMCKPIDYKWFDVSVGGEGVGGAVEGSGVVTQRGGWINGPVWQRKGQQSAIDMFNKLALMTAGVIVSAALRSARHMVANRHDIAACPDLSIPSQWH